MPRHLVVSRNAAIASCRVSRIREDLRQPGLPSLAGVEHGAARLGLLAKQKLDLEPASRQQWPKTLGPFDQRDPFSEGILDAELPGFLRGSEPVKVEVPDHRGPELVDLHESEGRARHFLEAATGTDESAGKGGFAGAEITL